MKTPPDIPDFLKALASETRLCILLQIFSDGEAHNVGDIASAMSISQSTASTHLSQMKRAGVLKSQRTGKQVFYQADGERIGKILAQLQEMLMRCCPPPSKP